MESSRVGRKSGINLVALSDEISADSICQNEGQTYATSIDIPLEVNQVPNLGPNAVLRNVVQKTSIETITASERNFLYAAESQISTGELSAQPNFIALHTDTIVPSSDNLQKAFLCERKIIHFDDPFLRHRYRVRSLRILIADDRSTNREVLNCILEKAGHKCDQADSGLALLDRIVSEKYDVIMLDMHMPDLSGIEVLKQARVMFVGGESIPFIGVSADVTKRTIEAAKSAGVSEFIAKPVSVAVLLDAIAVIAARKHKEKVHSAVSMITTADCRSAIDRSVIDELIEISFNRDFVERFISVSLYDIQATLDRIKIAMLDGERITLRNEIHALHGIASNIGAVRLAKACANRIVLSPCMQIEQTRRFVRNLVQIAVEALNSFRNILGELRADASEDS